MQLLKEILATHISILVDALPHSEDPTLDGCVKLLERARAIQTHLQANVTGSFLVGAPSSDSLANDNDIPSIFPSQALFARLGVHNYLFSFRTMSGRWPSIECVGGEYLVYLPQDTSSVLYLDIQAYSKKVLLDGAVLVHESEDQEEGPSGFTFEHYRGIYFPHATKPQSEYRDTIILNNVSSREGQPTVTLAGTQHPTDTIRILLPHPESDIAIQAASNQILGVLENLEVQMKMLGVTFKDFKEQLRDYVTESTTPFDPTTRLCRQLLEDTPTPFPTIISSGTLPNAFRTTIKFRLVHDSRR